MAIVGVGLDDQSLSTDDSYSHVFLDPQTPTVKGQYFQRGLLLRGPETSRQFPDPSDKALINVGGIRYAFPWSTLEEFPKSRLCRLGSCSTLKEIAEYCDDYDQLRHEYFFDRDPIAFRAIFTFLAKGRLHLIEEVCSVALHSELVYWGIDTQYMEPCCEHRMMYRVEQVAEHQRKEDEWCQRRREMLAVVTGGSFFHKLGEAVENPHSGPAGKVFAFLSVLMVVVTIVGLCISTMPDQRQEQAAGECSQSCRDLFLVESFCVAWFSLEYVVRLLHSKSKLEFLQSPLNIIDVAAILPYYILLFLEVKDETVEDIVADAGRSTLDKLGLVLRVTRALRILYVMRLARHSLGLQTLGLTIHRSMTDFGLLLLFMCVAITLFSPLVHLAESELAPDAARMSQLSFSSIPISYWWAIIAVTTVGYGDMVPHSIPGQLIAFISILAGILILSFPTTSIFHTFYRVYLELKEENKRLWKEEKVAEAEESMRERETWPDNWPETDILPGLEYFISDQDNTDLAQSTIQQPLISSVTHKSMQDLTNN